MPNTPLLQAITYMGRNYSVGDTTYPLAATLGMMGGISLLGVGSAVNVRGFFRDSRGRRIGPSYGPAVPVPAADSTANSGAGVAPVTLLTYLGLSNTPSGAVDFLITYSDGDLYYDTGDAGDSDIRTLYANYPQILAVSGKGDITPLVGHL